MVDFSHETEKDKSKKSNQVTTLAINNPDSEPVINSIETDHVEIRELNAKAIETLTLISCNTGHLDYFGDYPYDERNVAIEFLDVHKISSVYAYDGNAGAILGVGYTYTPVFQQEEFYDILENVGVEKRKPEGMVKYYMADNKIHVEIQ
ncbi:hypothetical protein RBH29_15585 [Herbivorax sp. ANBcel31]|uniref:hypothetical protein n=1 Tax=Herbivorax sp. ANBcel31 TaxID=3069754 RepID=UPI0027B20BB1|nr:hypothetical protein [Herbivorax sp. ANBcel31]MDQ2087853.1 hypothetical protein [Herbivorax sp. ANBcel31]